MIPYQGKNMKRTKDQWEFIKKNIQIKRKQEQLHIHTHKVGQWKRPMWLKKNCDELQITDAWEKRQDMKKKYLDVA